jgi:phthalate 4,5-dioxygenase
MTTAAENELLTRVGPGTPMGGLMRNYWLPAMLSSELTADGDPIRIKLLGEPLIAFRDSNGKVGVMDHRCPHRCASLFFGRNEEGGIRCVYHGWKFDADGNCLDMANVPPHQDFKHKVHAKAYKTAERNGLVWVYMGDQSKIPALPPIEPTLAPESELSIQFLHRSCNWLQGLEGELDTSHLGILHYGAVKKLTDLENQQQMNRYAVANRAPEYVAHDTDYGFMYAAYRPADESNTYWRLGQFLFPFWAMPPINPFERNVLARAYVPLDDENTMIVMLYMKKAYTHDRYARNDALPGSSQVLRYLPNTTDWLGRWRVQENAQNDYMMDRELQRTGNYTGIDGITLQDQAVTESMGPITDRTWEHLAPSDVAINRTRRQLVRAATAFAKDGTLPKSARDPSILDGVRGGQFVTPNGVDWLAAYQENLEKVTLRPALARAAE